MLRRLAGQALEAGGGSPEATLSLALADDITVRRLNRDYRGLDETTDVLAFAFHYPGHYQGDGDPPVTSHDEPTMPVPDQQRYLGEVIISYPQCVRQANAQGHDVARELAHLLAHGILHLLGYDHLSPEEERVMQEREATALAGSGFPTERA